MTAINIVLEYSCVFNYTWCTDQT